MDVSTWLQGLCLERHEAAFRDNLIDMDVVHELTENDLEKLGLAHLIHEGSFLRLASVA